MAMDLKQMVRRSSDGILLVAILGLCAVAAVAVVVDPMITRRHQQTAVEFQRLVRGLGLGCQADLARCTWQFDARLMGDVDAPLDIVSGRDVSNPWYSLSLFPAPAEVGDAPEQE